MKNVTSSVKPLSATPLAFTSAQSAGQANYVLPKDWGDKKLPEGSLFPTAHTVLIIQKAQAGEKMFLRPVFDGSDEAGIADVSAFIGTVIDLKASPDLAASFARKCSSSRKSLAGGD